jgi:DNA adenine methylase
MKAVATSESLRPFIKWAGGKRSLVEQMEPHVPKRYGTYHEPFAGSAALFFHLKPPRARLSDNNERLIRTYKGLKDSVEQVIELLDGYRRKHSSEFFYALRQEDIDASRSDAKVAAWFIYLNKTGFNGLYRVNSKNRFNVPFGDYAKPNICDAPRLRACARALQPVDVALEDFETAAARAEQGDFVYFDPPYVPLSTTSYFTSYTRQGFGEAEQRRLRDVALALAERGVHVMLSNSSADLVYELYKKAFKIVPIQARRNINSRVEKRGEITELLMISRRTT